MRTFGYVTSLSEPSRDAGVEALSAAFTYGEARRAGLSERRIRALKDRGLIEPLARGLYLRADAPAHEADLLQVAAKAPDATLCLRSALARHGLTDEIPDRVDLALPRGRRVPVSGAPVRWHLFDADTFDVGREVLQLAGGLSLGLYGPERCIVDAFRLRHLQGSELAHEALKAWLRRKGSRPASLLRTASSFPRAEPALRHALEVLL